MVGVVKFWELEVSDASGKHVTQHYNWDFGTEAFKEAKALDPYSAILYACSGPYGGHRIATWNYERQ